MADAGVRFPVLKPLLERCLSLHAEDRPSASETMRALEGHRADPCTYHVAGHGAGVLAERWFQVDFAGTHHSTIVVATSSILNPNFQHVIFTSIPALGFIIEEHGGVCNSYAEAW